MADNVTLNAMTGGSVVASDEVTDATLGTAQVQYVKLMDGTINGTSKAAVDATYGLAVDVKRTVSVALGSALPAGSNVIGGVTQSGTWTATVSGTVAATQSGTWNVGLSTGSNVIGSVTQSGTWNVGSITTLPALPTGANVIGAVTQSGIWNVSVNSALPTGTNSIGTVGLSSGAQVAIGSALPVGSNTIGGVTQGNGLSSGTSNAWYVANASGATLSQGSASPTTSATLIAASSTARRSITITNTGSVQVNIGGSGVISTTGVPLAVGASVTFDGAARAAFYGITASGTGSVAYITESD